MSTKYYVDDQGAYLGGYGDVIVDDEVQPNPALPQGAIEVPSPPDHALDVWDGAAFVPDATVLINRHLAAIQSELDAKLKTGILWAFNLGETPHPISLSPSMRETLSTFKQLLDAGEVNPHGGYVWSNGTELRKPDLGDLSDLAINEICLFAGQWALKIARVAITEKQLCAVMTVAELQAYDATLIDWTVTWDIVVHPDWTDNLVLKNP